MKTLKQRFSCWFNKRHDRRGTLWEERFKSVLVEDGHTARVIAAYIDLNPVRAGIVKDPKDYRWCGYAAALAGDRASLEGICRVMGCSRRSALRGHGPKKPGELMEEYRVILFEDGKEVLGTAGSSGCDRIARRGMTRSEVKKVLKSGGKLGRSQMLLHRVDKFVNGAALGTREFVMEVAESIKESCGLKRTREGHALRESAMSLFSLGGIEDTMIP